jgi:hypothetical protein
MIARIGTNMYCMLYFVYPALSILMHQTAGGTVGQAGFRDKQAPETSFTLVRSNLLRIPTPRN